MASPKQAHQSKCLCCGRSFLRDPVETGDCCPECNCLDQKGLSVSREERAHMARPAHVREAMKKIAREETG